MPAARRRDRDLDPEPMFPRVAASVAPSRLTSRLTTPLAAAQN